MKLYYFNKLSLEEQQAVLWRDGEFLDNHITEQEKCNVYALFKFFIEVVYDAVHNTITEVRSFKYGHSLDKYSSKLDY
jgi:hypothetical protein